jgi:large subunit ribosomal protein L21
MYAIIESGGKQYRVKEGQFIRLETIPAEVGQEVNFDQVLFLSQGEKYQVGAPYVGGAKVTGKVIKQGRARKVRIVKFKRRKHHMKWQGHRQNFTEIKITSVLAA